MDLIPPFSIHIRHGSRDYTFVVEMLNYGMGLETYKVIARNKTLVLESNRPLLRRKGLKHRKPEWKLVSGEISSSRFLEQIQDAIYSHVEGDKSIG